MQPLNVRRPVNCFTFSRKEALKIFKNIQERNLVLAILGGVTPQAHWEGCMVYQGEGPPDVDDVICIGISGPSSEEVQQQLVQAFEKYGIRVTALYEGGPEPKEVYAQATSGRWATP